MDVFRIDSQTADGERRVFRAPTLIRAYQIAEFELRDRLASWAAIVDQSDVDPADWDREPVPGELVDEWGRPVR